MRARSQVTLCASTKSNKYMYTDTEKSSGVGTDAKDARRVARDLVCKNKPGKKSLKKNKHGKKSFKKKMNMEKITVAGLTKEVDIHARNKVHGCVHVKDGEGGGENICGF